MDFEELREKTLWAVRLRQHKSPTSGRWREAAEARRANKGWLRHSRNIAISMHEKMREINMSPAELAEKMGCTLQFVSTLLKGTENLSLETIFKIESALGLKLIN